jgi:hypothetical protein
MPHNSYVQVMAEMGIPGIILFLMIIWQCLRQFKPLFIQPLPPAHAPPLEESTLFGHKDPSNLYNTEASYHIDDSEYQSESDIPDNIQSLESLNNIEKSVAIAAFITFAGWLLYIFLGNQGYSIWMYFYLGLCTALANFMPNKESKKNKTNPIFSET